MMIPELLLVLLGIGAGGYYASRTETAQRWLAQRMKRTPAEKPPEAAAARCASCGTANDDGARFCGECGSPMTSPV